MMYFIMLDFTSCLQGNVNVMYVRRLFTSSVIKFIVTILSVRVFNVRPYIYNIVFILSINKVFQCLPYAKYFKGSTLNILERFIELIIVE
jgi:hypothetical protein